MGSLHVDTSTYVAKINSVIKLGLLVIGTNSVGKDVLVISIVLSVMKCTMMLHSKEAVKSVVLCTQKVIRA